jgi:hypothetical protein
LNTTVPTLGAAVPAKPAIPSARARPPAIDTDKTHAEKNTQHFQEAFFFGSMIYPLTQLFSLSRIAIVSATSLRKLSMKSNHKSAYRLA